MIDEEHFFNMGCFLAELSHQLNTSLGVAVATVSFFETQAAALCKYQSDTHNKRELESLYVKGLVEAKKLLNSSLERATKLIRSLRSLQINVFPEDAQIIPIRRMLHSAVIKPWREQLHSGIRLVLECNDDLVLRSYPEILNIVLNNLVENSILHSFRIVKTGGILIAVEQKNKGIEIIYTDTGEGLHKEEASHILEPSFSAEYSISAKGIGLNIVYNAVVGSLEGSITYEGNPKSGMKYRIFIPDIDSGDG